MTLFAILAVLLLGLGIQDARRHKSPAAFFVNNRSSGFWLTGSSILASCIGGSATIGMAGLAWQVGTPAFWWLGSGACGLLVLTLFLAKKVRETGAFTMPELICKTLGQGSRTLVSCVILIAWTAILAAQFTAMEKLTVSLTGFSPAVSMCLGASLITLYSALGGQASVIRSDMPQCALLFAGLAIVCGWLVVHNPGPVQTTPVELVNNAFPVSRLSYFLILLGGSYVVCPMLFGRILSARDARSAILGGCLASAGLVVAAVIIVAIGISCRGLVPPNIAPDSVLTFAITLLPPQVGTALLIALLAAVLSSADSCLITASTVGCHDLLHRDDAVSCRLAAIALGCAGWFLATRGHGILNLLLMANDVYVCGVVAPVFCALMLPKGLRVQPFMAILAVLLGGTGGVLSTLSGNPATGYAGIAVSALCVLGGVLPRLRSYAKSATCNYNDKRVVAQPPDAS